MAALVVVMVWMVSMGYDARPVQGAPAIGTGYGRRVECGDTWYESLLIAHRNLDRMERVEHLWALQAQREEAAQFHEYRSAVRREQARRAVEARRIADLVPEQYSEMVLAVAERFDMDPRLIAAVGYVESRWYAKALGTHGDSGLMQILPSTAEWIAGRMGLAHYDLYDPITNLTMGAWYLHAMYHEYGNWEQALAGYNGGPRGALKGANHPYTKLVTRVYQQGR